MNVHELKCEFQAFQAVWERMKTADFRFDDRRFRAGDIVILEELGSAESGEWEELTGRTIRCEVSHVQPGPAFGIPEGYVVLSLRITEFSA